MIKKLLTEEISSDIVDEFEDAIDSVLGSAVSEKRISKAIFGNKEFELKKVKIGKYEVSVVIIWFIWVLSLWVLSDDVMWFFFGIIFASSIGYVVKINGKRISVSELRRKKKKKKRK